MLRNVLIAITAAVLLGTISLLAAEKMKEKKAAEKEPPTQALERQRPGMLLDELIAAYKANDREKMGQIIQKMEQRREKMQKFARLNGWHRWAHQGMDQEQPRWHREAQRSGVPVGGPGWDGWGERPEQRRWAGTESRFNRGPESRFNRGQGEGPRWRHGCGCCCCCERNGWGPPPREYRQMPGCDQGERPWREGMGGRGHGDWSPGPGQRFGPEFNPERQRMRPRDNPPPDMDW